MVSGKYDYSIEVAREIYKNISSDEEAIKVCCNEIEQYYSQKGCSPQKRVVETSSLTTIEYKGGNQSISLVKSDEKPAMIMLYQNEEDTDRLVEEAFSKKKVFGLPVFTITIMEDGMYPFMKSPVMLNLMSKELYSSLDTPKEQAFHQWINVLDGIESLYDEEDIEEDFDDDFEDDELESNPIYFDELKEAAYDLAELRGFFKKGIKNYNFLLNYKERYISESIIRKIWDYHKTNNTDITDGQETRLIMKSCIYAGMFAAKYPLRDEDELINDFENHNITRIIRFVESDLNFDSEESFTTSLVANGLVQDVYNQNTYLYSNCSTPEKHWEYYKDIACVMFELGAIYFRNRD